jgi:hypothetical protein
MRQPFSLFRGVRLPAGWPDFGVEAIGFAATTRCSLHDDELLLCALTNERATFEHCVDLSTCRA